MAGRKKRDSLSYSEFSRLMPKENANPTQDSPGDSAEDELRETLLGMDYDQESLEDLREPLELDEYTEDEVLHHEKVGESVEELDENLRVISSKRPAPKDEEKTD